MILNMHLEKDMFIFTTCGHVIHESCLYENLPGWKEITDGFSCFLCTKKSNFMLPMKLPEKCHDLKYMLQDFIMAKAKNIKL